MGLPQGHALIGLTLDDGFKIKEPAETCEPLKFAPGEMIPIRTVIPYTEGRAVGWKLQEHVLGAKARKWPGIKAFEFNRQSIAICGGGHSLGETLHELRNLQRQGCKVMAINRTHDYLLGLPQSHKVPWIKPWAGILLEPTPNAAGYMKPTPGVRYYVASQCAPETFDKFEKSEHFIWHAQAKREVQDNLSPEELRVMVPTMGSTCGMRAIMLAYIMGFTDIHLFGMDSCYDSRKLKNGMNEATGYPSLHAYHKPETIHDFKELVVRGWSDGSERSYWGNGNMLAQADEFQIFMTQREGRLRAKQMDPHHIIVHGYGILPDMAREYGCHASQITQERKVA